MSKHIHVHVHDSWEESKHPRKGDGKFGSGTSAGVKGELAELLKRNPQLAKLREEAVKAEAAVEKAHTLEEKLELKQKAERAARAYSQAKDDARAREERATKQVKGEGQ